MYYKEFLKVLAQLATQNRACVEVDDKLIFFEVEGKSWKVSSKEFSSDLFLVFNVHGEPKYLQFRKALRDFLPLL